MTMTIIMSTMMTRNVAAVTSIITTMSMNTNITTTTMMITAAAGDHGHEGHHHADEVFDSIGIETPKKYTIEKDRKSTGSTGRSARLRLRAQSKGIVEGEDGQWIHFDYVPGEPDVRTGSAEITGRLCHRLQVGGRRDPQAV